MVDRRKETKEWICRWTSRLLERIEKTMQKIKKKCNKMKEKKYFTVRKEIEI